VLKSREIDGNELRQMLHTAVASGDARDVFFEQFEYHFPGQPFLTLERGEALLGKCKEVAPSEYAKLRKGTQFYWLARAAFEVRDYAAVSDDLRAADDRGDDRCAISSPAVLFLRVDDSVPDQASLDLVKILRSKIENAIDQYSQRPGANPRPLKFSDIQDAFLRPAIVRGNEHLRTLVTAFISFILEWEHRSHLIELRTEPGTAEPFFLHLFKGCVLFESLLKANPKAPQPGSMLGSAMNALRSELGLPAKLKNGDFDFPTIVSDLTSDDPAIATAMERTRRIRNATGHDLGWTVSLNGSQYSSLAGYVASSCLHAIACLYRQRP
jgi:hypothetical protein